MPSAVDPEEAIEDLRQSDAREQARRDRFKRAQQKRYEKWLKKRKAAEDQGSRELTKRDL